MDRSSAQVPFDGPVRHVRSYPGLRMPCAARLAALGHHTSHVSALTGAEQVPGVHVGRRVAGVAHELTGTYLGVVVLPGIDVSPHLPTVDEVASVPIVGLGSLPDPATGVTPPHLVVEIGQVADEVQMRQFNAALIREIAKQ